MGHKKYCSFMINYLIHCCNFLLMNICSSAMEMAGRFNSHFHTLQVWMSIVHPINNKVIIIYNKVVMTVQMTDLIYTKNFTQVCH